MEKQITVDDVRKRFKEETGKDAILVNIREGTYRTGYPKKITVQNYNPAYTLWLENFLVKNSA